MNASRSLGSCFSSSAKALYVRVSRRRSASFVPANEHQFAPCGEPHDTHGPGRGKTLRCQVARKVARYDRNLVAFLTQL